MYRCVLPFFPTNFNFGNLRIFFFLVCVGCQRPVFYSITFIFVAFRLAPFFSSFSHAHSKSAFCIYHRVCARLVYGAPNNLKYESSFGFRWFVYSPLFLCLYVYMDGSTSCESRFMRPNFSPHFHQTDDDDDVACLFYDIKLNLSFVLVFITLVKFGNRTKRQTKKTNHPRPISACTSDALFSPSSITTTTTVTVEATTSAKHKIRYLFI